MFLKRFCQACAVGVAVATWCSLAAAQALPRPSGSGGYASTELNRIYQYDIGTGYTGTSLNRIALNSARARVPNVGQASYGGSRLGLGLGFSSLNKPFSSYSPAPTVSPYLNLFREDLDGNSDLNYQTLVRPQLQQQQFNQQLQRQNLEVARRLQTISAQSDFNPAGSQTQAPTGHQTVFMYYGHYYPTPGRRR